MNPRDADPLRAVVTRYLDVARASRPYGYLTPLEEELEAALEVPHAPNPDPLTVDEDEARYAASQVFWAQWVADRDRPGITIPLLLAIVVVVAAVLALAVWGGTR